MWTAAKWIEVAIVGIAFGGLRLLWTTRRRKADNIRISIDDVLYYCFVGLELGLWVTFRWQAFHSPLVFLVVLVFVGIVVTGGRPLKSSQRSPRQVL